jgi:hypothetical protein
VKADTFLSRCEKVKPTGNGTWLACCPAHEDQNPSMAVRETDEGVVLVHCFAGCGIDAILGALGLQFDALFPDKPSADFVAPMRRRFPAADVLEAVAAEAFYVAYMAGTIASGYQLEPRDSALLWQSFDRIMEARKLANG